MLRIETQETFPEVPNVAIWGDNEAAEVVYAIPEIPRLRLVNGEPQFKFIKYRDVVGSNKKGAFVFFDVEVAVADADKATILEIWQKRLNDEHARAGLAGQPPQAKLGAITYTRGAVRCCWRRGR